MGIYPEILELTNEELDGLGMEGLTPFLSADNLKKDLLSLSSDGYYRLLVWLSRQFSGKIIFDVGTNRGVSAIALSANLSNRIYSYDIRDSLSLVDRPDNVTFILGDVFEDPRLLQAALIFLDTVHDGEFESKFVGFLREKAYKGWLVLDDIHLNGQMNRFWDEIEEWKLDITSLGHRTGTGLVRFGGNDETRNSA